MQVIKVPGINGGNEGCARTGNAIIEELGNIQTNESGKSVDKQLLDLEEIHLENSNLELTNKLIYENSIEAYEIKPRVFFLGGDHSISYSLVRGFEEYCKREGKEPCLIVFDSRPNLKKYSQEFPSNECWLRRILDEGFNKENILLVGVRNYSLEEINLVKKVGIRIMNLNNIEVDLEETCDVLMEFSDGKELYLSLDLSAVDPVFAPAATFQDTGGFTSRQLLYILQRMNKMKNLRALDLVEINSEEDTKYGNKTIKLGSKILSEFL